MTFSFVRKFLKERILRKDTDNIEIIWTINIAKTKLKYKQKSI